MNHLPDDTLIDIRNARAASSVVLVCEHASAHIPAEFDNLGLSPTDLDSHVAWDPGALDLAVKIAKNLDAVLVAAKTSRLVYDCNRPPQAADAMPARSEVVDVPGNTDLSDAQKAARVAGYYEPFRKAVSRVMHSKVAPVLVTVHSFTPTFHGKRRDVEIGVLHDKDSRLADALLAAAKNDTSRIIRRNDPYGPQDGVTHTLREHALPDGHLNIMLEVRNDLLADEAGQSEIADALSRWLSEAMASTEADAWKA